MNQKLSGIANLNFGRLSLGRKLNLLHALYGKILDILDAIVLNNLTNDEDQKLDHYYIVTLSLAEKILAGEEFQKLREQAPLLTSTLLGNGDIDIDWEFDRKAAYDFLGKIHAMKIKEWKPVTEPPASLEQIFQLIDIAIADHRARQEKVAANFGLVMEGIAEAKHPPLKRAHLDIANFQLVLNGGDNAIPFKSNKDKEGLEKEAKIFKLLAGLWESRRELRNGKVMEQGDTTTLENLMQISGSASLGATRKMIERLGGIFQEHNVPIEIRSQNEKYTLIVNYSKT